VRLPGSKSITNRALVCAALAPGETTLTGALYADDTEAMVGAVRALGAEVDCDPGAAIMRVRGIEGAVGEAGIVIDARMSGTTGRFMAPVAALSEHGATIDGHPQLRARPFGDLADALCRLGVSVEFLSDSESLPVRIRGPIRKRMAHVAADRSSQFLSGLMMAAPVVPGGMWLPVVGSAVSQSYVEMTAAVMEVFGASVRVEPAFVRVLGGGYRSVERLAIEPDASSASYFMAAAAVTGGTVSIEGLGAGSIQGDARFAAVLETMGATIDQDRSSTTVTGGPLRGVDVDLADMSDTAPTLAVVAAVADTPTRVRGIGFVRGKESDRIAAVVAELARCGVEARELEDGFEVVPGTAVTGGRIRTYDDHRIAMAFSVLGLRVPGIQIENPGCVAKTFPGFYEALDGLRSGKETGPA
jgi:3-phosphoshikimate 1-carboxyvinyltransferase